LPRSCLEALMYRLALYSSVLLVASATRIAAGDLVKIWEVRLSDLPGSNITSPTALVYSVSFSPDGRDLAVVARNSERAPATFAILAVDNPHNRITAVEHTGPISSEFTGLAISWSRSGAAVATPEVFRILTAPWAACTLEHTIHAVFYDLDRVADVQPGFPDSTILSFDSNCNLLESWHIRGLWEQIDGSADSHLLALSNNIPRHTEVLLLDPLHRKLVRRWPMADTNGTWPVFADSGRAVCAIDGTGRHGVAHCWDVDGDQELSETSSGNPHGKIAAALHARRVVLSNYGWRIQLEGFQTEVGSLQKRAVWDFGTGKVVVSWKARYQHPDREQISEPYPIAISPDGTIIAEGGLGVLSLYRVRP
jgi:WD40 repeat protein